MDRGIKDETFIRKALEIKTIGEARSFIDKYHKKDS